MDAARTAPVHTTVVGVFDDLARARAALEELRRAGFGDNHIGFFGPGCAPGDSEECGRGFEDELAAGKSVVIVHEADERAEEAREVIRRHEGSVREPSDIGTYGTGVPATPY
jgi:hypothetical protein